MHARKGNLLSKFKKYQYEACCDANLLTSFKTDEPNHFFVRLCQNAQLSHESVESDHKLRFVCDVADQLNSIHQNQQQQQASRVTNLSYNMNNTALNNTALMYQKYTAKGTMKLKKLTRKLRATSLSPKNKSPTKEKRESPPRRERVSALNEEDKLIEDKENDPKPKHRRALSDMEDGRPSFLFDGNEDDNGVGVKTSRLPKFLMPNPTAKTSKTTHVTSRIGSPTKPPLEIMVDHLAEPPSPMREPKVNVINSPSMGRRLLDDYQPGSFLEPSPRETPTYNPCIGDPLGDIAMHRQLMDAQRLVRIILGKPFSKSQEILDANSILQAIRSYALMKAELMNLRKKQEISDGDPPAILESLGSPTATTPGTAETGAFFSEQTSDLQDDDNDCGKSCESVGHQSAESNEKPDSPVNTSLEEPNETIRRLQAELATANRTISELKEKMEGRKPKDTSAIAINQVESSQQHAQDNQQQLTVEEIQQDESPNHREVESEEFIEANDCSQQLAQNDRTDQEEPRQDEDLDLLLDDIVRIPQQDLTKDVVRKKIEKYYDLVNQNSADNQILEMEKKMQQMKVESDKRILEMENQLKRQDENLKKQLDEVVLKNDPTVESPISVLKQLSFEHDWDH